MFKFADATMYVSECTGSTVSSWFFNRTIPFEGQAGTLSPVDSDEIDPEPRAPNGQIEIRSFKHRLVGSAQVLQISDNGHERVTSHDIN